MKFYISKSDLEKVDRGCDLGDSVGVRVYMYPHVDRLPELVEFSYVEPKVEPKYAWMYRSNNQLHGLTYTTSDVDSDIGWGAKTWVRVPHLDIKD